MKKVINLKQSGMYSENGCLHIFDSTDYLIIQKDNQHIDDKYVDFNGNEYNKYTDFKENDIVIRKICKLYLGGHHDSCLCFNSQRRSYELFRFNYDKTREINLNLNTRNSLIDFDNRKKSIIMIFSKDISIKV